MIFFLAALPQSPAPLLISLSYQSHLGHSPLSTPPSFSTPSLVLVCAFPVLRNSPPGLLCLKSSSSQRSSAYPLPHQPPAPQILASPLSPMLTSVVSYLLPQSLTGRRATSALSLTGGNCTCLAVVSKQQSIGSSDTCFSLPQTLPESIWFLGSNDKTFRAVEAIVQQEHL